MEYSGDLIYTYRKKIYDFLKDYEGEPVVIEGIHSDLLRKILLGPKKSFFEGGDIIYLRDQFMDNNIEIAKVIEKIDFRNISFDNFNIGGIDFSKLKNVSINPDTINFANEGEICYFNGVFFTKEININNKLKNVSFKGSSNALININNTSQHTLFLKGNDFCDTSFKHPIDNAEILYCNFEGSRGTIIDLNNTFVLKSTLYDATVYGKCDTALHFAVVPSIEEIKRVYGDLREPTLIRRKDFD